MPPVTGPSLTDVAAIALAPVVVESGRKNYFLGSYLPFYSIPGQAIRIRSLSVVGVVKRGEAEKGKKGGGKENHILECTQLVSFVIYSSQTMTQAVNYNLLTLTEAVSYDLLTLTQAVIYGLLILTQSVSYGVLTLAQAASYSFLTLTQAVSYSLLA